MSNLEAGVLFTQIPSTWTMAFFSAILTTTGRVKGRQEGLKKTEHFQWYANSCPLREPKDRNLPERKGRKMRLSNKILSEWRKPLWIMELTKCQQYAKGRFDFLHVLSATHSLAFVPTQSSFLIIQCSYCFPVSNSSFSADFRVTLWASLQSLFNS